MRSTGWGAIVVLVSVFVVGNAQAEDSYAGPWEKFSIVVGGFATESDTSFQINPSTAGVGAVVDLENTLGVERSFNTYRIDLVYRLGDSRRHQLEFHYFDSKRTGDKRLKENLQIGDEFFPAGTGVVTEFGLRFANFDYVYNFLMDERVRLGVSAGLHTTGVKLSINDTLGTLAEEESFTAPLPMLGLRAEVLLTERWRLKTDINLFYIKIDEFTGRLGDTYVGLEYIPFRNFGFGAGLNGISYRVEADDDLADFSGELKFQLTGFMIYGKYFF